MTDEQEAEALRLPQSIAQTISEIEGDVREISQSLQRTEAMLEAMLRRRLGVPPPAEA